MFSMQATYETQQSAITQIFWETKQILADNLLGRCCHFTPKYMVLFHKSTGETPPWKMNMHFSHAVVLSKQKTWKVLPEEIFRYKSCDYFWHDTLKYMKIND